MSAETKRRGRPKSEVEVESEVPSEPEYDARNAWRVREEIPAGPKCNGCGMPTERSETLLKAYKLVALRCKHCKSAAIEGDKFWYDIHTAAAGSILNRARVIYESKNPTSSPPSVSSSRLHEVMFSDDERWETETL